jgi:uncharacterized protein
MLTIDIQTARRFILGRQGLWPGRRWRGVKGTEQAMRAIEYLQLDPLQIIARSHDITLHSRVLDYKPDMWEDVTYKKRKFFDWGGWLAARPMDELPYWRTVMHRERDGDYGDRRIRLIGREYAKAIAEMRGILQERGIVSSRDFEKDHASALYYLWQTGEVMTHHRDHFERAYALTEKIAPADLIREISEAEIDRFLVKKEVSCSGLARIKRTGEAWGRGEPDRAAKKVFARMLADGELIEVQVEGWKMNHYALASDAKTLRDLSAGRIPKAWTPLETTTTEEVLLLAPLDQVSARGRAKVLFDFDYVWEVYKPAHLRKFGYYTMPILWGDQLVARFDSKLDRTTNTFVILGLWLEEKRLGKDEAFAEALAQGFARFMKFLDAKKLDAKAVREPLLRGRLNSL